MKKLERAENISFYESKYFKYLCLGRQNESHLRVVNFLIRCIISIIQINYHNMKL